MDIVLKSFDCCFLIIPYQKLQHRLVLSLPNLKALMSTLKDLKLQQFKFQPLGKPYRLINSIAKLPSQNIYYVV